METKELLNTVQSPMIERLDKINLALAVIAAEVLTTAQSIDKVASEQLPDEMLASAHSLIIQAVYEIGQRIGELKADAAIDAAQAKQQ
jgi:hypothetical protein